ncbi:hypothetical protein R6Q59_025188 [Mikania micrantha]|uniref:ZCF37 n=1 Tax=Mikania micrantha TaxID=192012 RepID=A0A5N6PBF0_9ASTR|nr:hypothetical protein E3N88_10359 [Mikania micrantha]
MSFMCGSLNNQEDDFQVFFSSPQPPRKARSHKCCCIKKKQNNKNPYSNRGLDKFEALLADLDDKKRKIFTQKGSQYISFVRFMYSNSNGVKPIIVWLKHPSKHLDKDHHKQNKHEDNKSSSIPKLQGSVLDHHHHRRRHSEPPGEVTSAARIKTIEAHHAKPLINKLSKKVSSVQYWKLHLKRKLDEWWTPSYNLPLFVILVMFFLTFFGRSLAIICTSIAWYMIPTVDRTLVNTTTKPKKMIKIQHSRKPSENKMLYSPKPFFSGPINIKQTNKMNNLMSF